MVYDQVDYGVDNHLTQIARNVICNQHKVTAGGGTSIDQKGW